MARNVIVGRWIEREAREITRCPTTYAADWEKLRTTPGEYVLTVVFEGGYKAPMPYWVLVNIDAERLDGRFYNAFGGNIFGSNDAKPGPAILPVQMHAYQLADLVAEGVVELDEGWAWLATKRAWKHPSAPETWSELRKMDGGTA